MQEKKRKITSAFFITFNGNCEKALRFYQKCFGGDLHFDTFNQSLAGIDALPIVSGSLVSEKFTVFGSDLVHNEGRKAGNFMAIYIHCDSLTQRSAYLEKLEGKKISDQKDAPQKLIEITDVFEVRWIFGI